MCTYFTSKIRRLIIPLLALGFIVNADAAIYYVNASAPGGDGTSWSKAFKTLTPALNAASSSSVPNQIWVAAGTYKPTTTCGNMTATFQIPSNVAIYGGFKGTETSISQRNRDANPTILSGDICNLGHPTTVQTDNTKYSWHVLTAGALTGVTGVTLDSLIVRDGYAGGPDLGQLDPSKPGQFVIAELDQADDAGGGLLARHGSQLTLNNMRFEYNATDATLATVGGNPLLGRPAIASGGGAVAVVDENTFINVSNSLFQYNNAFVLGGNGGALNAIGEGSGYKVVNSTFNNNTAFRNGGAIHGKDAGTITVQTSNFKNNIAAGVGLGDESGGAIGTINTNLTVKGSYFEGNIAGVLAGAGGAIFFHIPFDDGTPYTLIVNNSVFNNNQAFANGGGAINIFGVEPHTGSSASINGSLFVGNLGGVGGAVRVDSLITSITNSLFIGNNAWIAGGAVNGSNILNVIVPVPYSSVRPTLTLTGDVFDHNNIIGFPQNTAQCTFPVTVFPCTFFPLFFDNILAAGFGPFFGGPPTSISALNQGGGAIAAGFSAVVNISKSSFTYNTANSSPSDDGGAVLVGGTAGSVNTDPPGEGMNQANVTLSNSFFFGNTGALGNNNVACQNLAPSQPNNVLYNNQPCNAQ